MKSEYKIISDMIPNNTRVLDVGCDDGTLMEFLKKNKNVDIRGIEISKNKGAPRMMSVQNPYNLVNRTYEIGMSEISIREKCGLLVYYPLAAGGLSGKYRNGEMPKDSRMALFKGWERHLNPLAMKAYDEYFKLAKNLNLTMVQLAQSFVNSRPFVTSNIIGATTMDQLKENVESIDIKLTGEVMEKINLIHNNNPNPSP